MFAAMNACSTRTITSTDDSGAFTALLSTVNFIKSVRRSCNGSLVSSPTDSIKSRINRYKKTRYAEGPNMDSRESEGHLAPNCRSNIRSSCGPLTSDIKPLDGPVGPTLSACS
ncbi:hypothetical protein D3C81_938300 [compost metagenome]